MKVSDHVLERLRDWEVEYVFSSPGDGINGLLAAWGRAEDRPAAAAVGNWPRTLSGPSPALLRGGGARTPGDRSTHRKV
ncbi:hypothetical protein [Streptomyces sp. NPDC002825]|uniref:hypothetical protein n=1 Tax=Streptomyces sp. NPDC002825 TaxID=3154666 RepID=UPI003321CFC8